MAELQSIDLKVARRLREDAAFRREWFRAELEASVPDKFRAFREERGLTQEDLAAKTGDESQPPVKQSAISRFERSTRVVWSVPWLLRLAEAMGGVLDIRIVRVEDAIDAVANAEADGSFNLALSEPDHKGARATLEAQPSTEKISDVLAQKPLQRLGPPPETSLNAQDTGEQDGNKSNRVQSSDTPDKVATRERTSVLPSRNRRPARKVQLPDLPFTG